MKEQVQCSLYYPGLGFQYDKIRMAGLEFNEWAALQAELGSFEPPVPHLSALLNAPFPITLQRSEALQLAAEFKTRDLTGELDEPALGAYLTLGLFLAQVNDQREAGAAFEIDPGE